MKAVVCHTIHQPLCTNSFICKCSLRWIPGLVQSLWLLCTINTGSSEVSSQISYWPVSWSSWSFGFAGLVPSLAPVVPRCGNCWRANSKPVVWDWVVTELVSLLLSCTRATRASPTVLPRRGAGFLFWVLQPARETWESLHQNWTVCLFPVVEIKK